MFNFDIYVWNGINLEKKSIFTDYNYFKYTEKTRKLNNLEFQLNPQQMAENINIDFWEYLISINFDLNNNTLFVVSVDDPKINGFVTSLSLKNSSSDNNVFEYTFNGFGSEIFYFTRIVAPAPKLNSEGNYILNDTFTNVMTDLFNDLKSGEASSSAFGTSNIQSGKILDIYDNIIFDIIDDPEINQSFRFKSGAEIVSDIFSFCRSLEIEYYIYGKLNTNGMIDIHIYQGKDISDIMIFSNISRGNVLNTEIKYNFANEFNFATVAGQGDGPARVVEYVDQGKSNMLFKELFVDASDVDDSNNLNDRGISKLEETKSKPTITTELSDDIGLNYGVDFNIADKVRFLNELVIKNSKTNKEVINYTEEFITNILEVSTQFQGQLKSIDFVLNNEIEFIPNRLKINNDNSNNNSRR